MLIEGEVTLHVALLAHRPRPGEQTLYEFLGVRQTWEDAVQLAAGCVAFHVSPKRFVWHGSDLRRYAAHPSPDSTRAIHIMAVKL